MKGPRKLTVKLEMKGEIFLVRNGSCRRLVSDREEVLHPSDFRGYINPLPASMAVCPLKVRKFNDHTQLRHAPMGILLAALK
jgi:hypothetical protein